MDGGRWLEAFRSLRSLLPPFLFFFFFFFHRVNSTRANRTRPVFPRFDLRIFILLPSFLPKKYLSTHLPHRRSLGGRGRGGGARGNVIDPLEEAKDRYERLLRWQRWLTGISVVSFAFTRELERRKG